MRASERFYDSQYTSFATGVQATIRREALDEDISQNGWLGADEYRDLWQRLGLTARSRVLDVACGSGGPTIFVAKSTGCAVTGIDVNEVGLEAGRQTASALGLDARVRFLSADASVRLPLPTRASTRSSASTPSTTSTIAAGSCATGRASSLPAVASPSPTRPS